MSEVEKPEFRPPRWSPPARLYLVGAIILVAGWITGAVIFVTAGAPEPGGDLAYGVGWERQYAFQMERMGGKAAVMGDEISQWFGSLWSGRRLGCTVAILFTVAACLCFLIARGLSLAAKDAQSGDGAA